MLSLRRALRPATLAAAIAGASILAGCGSSSSSSGISAGAYVKSVCTAVSPFEKDIVSRSQALNATSLSNAAQGKQALQGFLKAVSSDTQQALAQLKNAGQPNVKNGKQISTAIVGAFSQLNGAMASALTQANSLPTNSPEAFKTAAQQLSTNIRTSMTSIGSSLQSNTLKSQALEQAAAKEPTCKSLGA